MHVRERETSTWAKIARRTGAARTRLYVPAFSLARSVVERLGVRLTRVQPLLRPSAVRPGRSGGLRSSYGPGVDQPVDADSAKRFSPIVLGRADARILTDFVYLALRAGESRKVPDLDYEIAITGEELLFLPAVWDARCVHDANWRLLLREFDDQVAK
jgi:hypothetical protein